MSEENKALARKVYEIIASGDFERADELVDPSTPDNERPECTTATIPATSYAKRGARELPRRPLTRTWANSPHLAHRCFKLVPVSL